ncbi:Uncharacterized protein ESCO_000542 [Escovopsis weberi]|uniref:Uncharacterized protein n=1 Tax=Escovopsis weberi TaxID=150374 RepID=A0A0M8MTC0_ESCWE|nr:Uncharacterized protein ESCO_000542 [Escovopsis weberi]
MPSFFQFTQGIESHARPTDTSPLLGRFRAVPPRPSSRRRSSRPGRLPHGDGQRAARNSIHVGYGALIVAELEAQAENERALRAVGFGGGGGGGESGWVRWWGRCVLDLWVDPTAAAVKAVVDRWWSRYGLLIILPSLLYPLGNDYDERDAASAMWRTAAALKDGKIPGHGNARVQVNFWFFLFVFYGFYNITALTWISKVFNLYSLNWWPQSLGFPLTISLIAALSLAAPIPIYLIPATRFLTVHNTAWVSWTFITMAMPVAIAFIILMINERHIGVRHSLSETQRIFTASWWTGEPDSFSRRTGRRRDLPPDIWESNALRIYSPARPSAVIMQSRWLPASFVRFLWFCVALFIGFMAYVLGEAYAELYLRTLPHNNIETVVYVYGWVATVLSLDALTGWVLGIHEGERVGSYPLSWVFKLYFMLTYQTYVRALYARLRSPSSFIILQVLSSTSLVIFTPLMMTPLFHRAMTVCGLTDMSYGTYQKLQTRNMFIRFLAENTSMATFLGSILVLHFGANKDVYPYFAFDDDAEYDFNLTFYASCVTWGCELVASVVVRGLIALCFGVDVGLEGKRDLAVWPELLPTSVAVMLHVLQNMLFSIIRLHFRKP